MGKPEKENDNWRVGVLSPRVQGVMSASKAMGTNSRRTTMGGIDHSGRAGHSRESGVTVGEKAAMRLSATPMRNEGMGHAHRPSLATGKNVWR